MQSALSDQAQSCSDQGNQYPFCSPVSTDVWKNGSSYDFIWNFNYPFYVGYDSISLYLYYYIKFEYKNVKNFTNLDTSSGGIEVTVDDSWFLTPLDPGDSDKNWTILGFYLPSTVNAAQELASPTSMFPRPFNFTITQIAPPGNSTTNTTNTTNSTNTNNNNDKNNDNNNNNSLSSSSSTLPGWAIAIIVIAVIALVCGAAALIWAILISRRNKRNNKLIPIVGGGRNDSNRSGRDKQLYKDSGSINSQAKMTAFRSTDSVPMSAAENASSVGTLASRQTYTQPFTPYDNKLSSTDAVLLADTFRNTLGRSTADWNPTAGTATDGDEEQEELKRRRLGEALLQRQLEEDGTSVKHAGRFTRVKSLADIQKSAVFEHPTKY